MYPGVSIDVSGNLLFTISGNYYIYASVPAYRVNMFRAGLLDTNNTLYLAGTSEYSGGGTNSNPGVTEPTARSIISTILNIPIAPVTYKLGINITYYANISFAGGIATNIDQEVYSIVVVQRL